jgi:dimethylargininase
MQSALPEGFSYRFTDAVVRKPGLSVADGLRAVDRGQPDIKRFMAEHNAYVRVLERAGLKVEVLPPLEAFPDSVFVEDAALCLPGGTVILSPGAPSRAGEAEVTAAALSGLGHEIQRLNPEVSVDGGDILVTDSVILVGLSVRTNQAGFAALKNILDGWGYPVQAVHTPENVLHFKSDCSLLDSKTILATSRLSGAECFAPFRVLTVPPGEEAAANSVRVNSKVLVPAGYPSTAELITRAGYAVEVVRADQAALLDGGLSCMSLRFSKS